MEGRGVEEVIGKKGKEREMRPEEITTCELQSLYHGETDTTANPHIILEEIIMEDVMKERRRVIRY